MTLIFDNDLEQMILDKYKKDQICSDCMKRYWDFEFLLFWSVTLVLNFNMDIMMIYFHTQNKVSRSFDLDIVVT